MAAQGSGVWCGISWGGVIMPTRRRLLIVVADGERARFVRLAADNALHTERSFDSVSAHKRSSDLASDRPGASFHSDSSAHHAAAPRHDPHELAKERFADAVAAEINRAAGEFDELILVAPPHSLNSIREALDATAGAVVIGTLAKDLVKTPDDALWPHLKEWVQRVHRPAG
jgi:protein required for attachment to host cells